MSILGFFLTGVLAYPFGLHWDSARTFSLILVNGNAYLNNWLGWYFPLLWEVLYKLTGVPHIMGCYINMIYWIGVTILYLNVFKDRHYSLIFYFLFAWFPGTLLFIINITNNALMFVTLLLGIALFAYYLNCKRKWWFLISIIITLQCIFIRRDAFAIVVPLILVYFYILYYKKGRIQAVSYSALSAIFLFVFIMSGEKQITSRIANYEYMDALSVVTFQNMSAISYIKKEQKLPHYIFKTEYEDGEACLNDILRVNSGNDAKDSILCGDIMFGHIHRYVRGGDLLNIKLPVKDVFNFYVENMKDFLVYRIGFVLHFFSRSFSFYMYANDDYIYYDPPKPSPIIWAISYIFGFILGPLKNMYFLSFILLILDYMGFVRYRSYVDKLFIRSVIFISFLHTFICLMGSIDIQYRYLYPAYILQYLSFVYIVTRLKIYELVYLIKGTLVKDRESR